LRAEVARGRSASRSAPSGQTRPACAQPAFAGPDQFIACRVADAMTNSRGSAAKPVALDRVFEAYRASGHGFRKAFEDADRYLKLNRLMLPSLVKLALQGLAIAHRRRGTWA
jgi:hypothetical protein